MNDQALMERAIELAVRGRGLTRPNPLVGAVVVRQGRVVGEGWHERHGGAHAEVNALNAAGEAAAGATVYVTLEPCAHQGKTPPCTNALVRSGVAEVVIGAADPNPVASGGASRLRAAGLRVRQGVLSAACERLNPAFHHWHRTSRPWVTLKLAQSLDGALARRGERTALTGDAAWAEAHALRADHDAILIGIGTALTDDPFLTVRGRDTASPPVRIILDSRLRLPTGYRLLQTARDTPTWLVAGSGAGQGDVERVNAAGARVLHLDASPERGIAELLNLLAAEGIRSVLVEGGAAVARAFLREGAVNVVKLFVAPMFLGESAVRIDAAGLPPGRIEQVQQFGRDALLTLHMDGS